MLKMEDLRDVLPIGNQVVSHRTIVNWVVWVSRVCFVHLFWWETYAGEVLPEGEDLGVCFWGRVEEILEGREGIEG